jgi:hypothetical protein
MEAGGGEEVEARWVELARQCVKGNPCNAMENLFPISE